MTFSDSWSSSDGKFYVNMFKFILETKKSKEVPNQKSEAEVRKLYFWASNMRSSFRAGKLTPERAAVVLKFMNWATVGSYQSVDEWIANIENIYAGFCAEISDGEGPSKEEIEAAGELMKQREGMSEDEKAQEKTTRGRKVSRVEPKSVAKFPDEPGFVPAPKPDWLDKVSGMKTVREQGSVGRSKVEESLARLTGYVERTVEIVDSSDKSKVKPAVMSVQDNGEGAGHQKALRAPYGFVGETVNMTNTFAMLGFKDREDIYEDLARWVYGADRMKQVEMMGLSRDESLSVEHGFRHEWMGYKTIHKHTKRKVAKVDGHIRIENGVVKNPFYM